MDWICVSPKAGADLVVRGGHELKLVYPQQGAVPEDFLGLAFERFSLQPMDGPDVTENTARAVDYCLRHPNGGSACKRTRRSASDRLASRLGFEYRPMWELTKSFRFEAAHSLPGTTFGAASEEIHGHSFRAEVSVRGTPDPATGMLLDLGLLERSMAEVQKKLDHRAPQQH